MREPSFYGKYRAIVDDLHDPWALPV